MTMIQKNPWLSSGYEINPGILIKKLISSGQEYQIYENATREKILVFTKTLKNLWLDSGLLSGNLIGSCKHLGPNELFYILGDERQLCHLLDCTIPSELSEVLLFTHSLKLTRRILPKDDLSNAIYFEKLGCLLPTNLTECQLDDDVILGRYISGGIEISCTAIDRLARLTWHLSKNDIVSVCEVLGVAPSYFPLGLNNAVAPNPNNTPKSFCLIGRTQLETFFNDHIIDIVLNPEKYERLGIKFPSACILHGPPGCGKTFAVEKLVEFLGWPLFTVNSSNIGSKYIHETSVKIAQVFESAIESSPSVVVIDEMEAFLSERDDGAPHRLEEVGEFLRIIPRAVTSKVLIIGMTNRLDLIDKAILRRGRFDHVVEVNMPGIEEIAALLSHDLEQRPHTSIDIVYFAKKLLNHPLSDVVFLIREAARLAAKADSASITQEFMIQACDVVIERSPEAKSRNIGFNR